MINKEIKQEIDGRIKNIRIYKDGFLDDIDRVGIKTFKKIEKGINGVSSEILYFRYNSIEQIRLQIRLLKQLKRKSRKIGENKIKDILSDLDILYEQSRKYNDNILNSYFDFFETGDPCCIKEDDRYATEDYKVKLLTRGNVKQTIETGKLQVVICKNPNIE